MHMLYLRRKRGGGIDLASDRQKRTKARAFLAARAVAARHSDVARRPLAVIP